MLTAVLRLGYFRRVQYRKAEEEESSEKEMKACRSGRYNSPMYGFLLRPSGRNMFLGEGRDVPEVPRLSVSSGKILGP